MTHPPLSDTPTPASTGSSSSETARQLVEEHRLHLIRLVMVVALLLCVVAAIMAWTFLDGLSRVVCTVSVLVVALLYALMVSLALRSRARGDAELFSPAIPAVACFTLGIFHSGLGLFSPAPIALVVAVMLFLFYGILPKQVIAGGTSLTVFYLVAIPAIGVGLVEDPGMVDFRYREPVQVIEAFITSPFIMLLALAFFRARDQQNAGFDEQLTMAIQRASLNQALLREAREELERAVGARRGEGRYSRQVLGGHELGMLLGSGGMGEVYEAQDLETGREAAVKILGDVAWTDEHARARFHRELQIMRKLESPHIVHILGASEPDAGVPFIVMEKLSGNTLEELLLSEESSDRVDVAAMVNEVSLGLSVAHEAGIVHRDINPRNLFLDRTSDGHSRWKIIDFGISALQGESTETMEDGAPVGAPGYGAPELVHGETAADRRSDIYSLGAVVYRVITGAPPFDDGDLAHVAYCTVYEMPVAPRALVDVDQDVEDWMRMALAKEPGDRFEDAAEASAMFRLAVRGELPEPLRVRARELDARRPWRRPVSRI